MSEQSSSDGAGALVDRVKVESVEANRRVIVLSLDKGLYPLDVVYGAAYVLIDRAYVLLDRDEAGRIVVRVEAKDESDEAGLNALAGDFGNELLAQALRRKVTAANRPVIEAIVSAAIAGASGAMLPGTDIEDDDLDFLDDPLGIAVPWEEKFSKEARRAASSESTASDTAGPGDSGGFKPTSGKDDSGDQGDT